MRPFTFLPDDFFDLGEAGEFPIEVTAWVTPAEPNYQAHVSIVRAIVKVAYEGVPAQDLDVTQRLKKYPMTLSRWEDDIRKAWEKASERTWDDDDGAA